MPGLFTSMMRNVGRSGYRGLGPTFRSYHTGRGYLIPGQGVTPRTVQDGLRLAKQQMDWVRTAGMLRPRQGVLNVITSHEFAWNAWNDQEKEGFQYDASHPVPQDVYKAVLDYFWGELRKEAPGTVFSPGSMAIRTDRQVDGKPVFENRAMFISSGPDAEVMEVTKKYQSSIDGWADGALVEGTGSRVFRVRDLVGDDAYIGVSICLDAELDPVGAQMIIVPAAGWPNTVPPHDTLVLVNDATSATWMGPDARYNRAWRPVLEDSPAGKFFKALENAAPFAVPLLTQLALATVGAEKLAELRAPRRVLSPIPYELIPFGNGDVAVDTGEMPLPRNVSDARMDQYARAASTDDASLVTDGMGIQELDAYETALRDVAAGVDWAYLDGRADQALDAEVRRQLREGGVDLSRGMDDVVAGLDLGRVREAVRQTAYGDALAAVGAADGFQARIAGPLGEFLANGLVDSVFGKGLVDRMDQVADGTSYLQAAVADAVANARAHWLRENADALQAEAAQARDDAGRTGAEAQADRASLARVDEQLRADPGSADLQAEKQRLQAEIARRETEQKAADEAGADADRRIAENQDRLDQADRERKEAARRRAERHSETYPAER